MDTLRRLALLVLFCVSAAGCFRNLNEADLSDSGIKARIEQTLASQQDLDLRYVTIDVHSGVVTVSGLVNTPGERQLIGRLVRHIRGVDQLMLNLVVQE